MVHNQEIAEMFNEMADLLEIKGANPFRVRAYRTAAQLIANYSHPLAKMVAEQEDLTQLPGIGADLAKKIETMVKTGRFPQLTQLQKTIPKAVVLMLTLPGLGPKRVKILFDQLRIKNFSDLEKAAVTHKIRELRGFSDKSEAAILAEIKKRAGVTPRYSFATAQQMGEELLAYLKKCPDVQQQVIAGSYRRKKDTVGDLDILVTAKRGRVVTDYFVKFNKVAKIISHGDTRATVQLRSGLQVDLRVVKNACYGAALTYFTGSKAHNIAIRKMAVSRQLKINEYGVFKNKRKIAGKTEQEVYRTINLPYIEPELREDRGEIAAAMQGKLPKLIVLEDIRGDLHCHTHATDGRDSLEAMVKTAMVLGYEYIAITDHTQHLAMVHGQDAKRLQAQMDEIDCLNEKLEKSQQKIHILKSAEVDILEDGRLDLPDKILKKLDMTVCSVHSKFNLSQRKQTERIIRAMDNPYFTVLGHPSGRLINRRQPYEINIEKIFLAAKERGCLLEINAQPDRLDLTDNFCKLAKEMGIKTVISTDAHSIDQLNFMQYGVNQARRGWLEARDVANTYPLKSFLKILKR